MLVRPGGGKGGFQDYLENGQKKGRDLHRDELDQRLPLDGDLAVFEQVTTSQPGDGQKYDHITLSWDEDRVSDEMLVKAVQEFKEHALQAWPQEDRHRVAFYAEAHRPRILSYTNKETGEEIGRCTHIHIGIGRHDLLTGKSIDVLGYLGDDKYGNESPNMKYIDAWQESFNARNGFSSPKDNPKITPKNAVDTLARYTGQRPNALGTFNQRKAAVEMELQKAIIQNDVVSWSQFEKLLKAYGAVRPMNPGAPNECFRIEPLDGSRAMRLKGVFFTRQFIEKPTAEKIKIIQDQARTAYREQMQPRKEPAYVAGVLTEWQQLKARENRYVHTGSATYRDTYKPADLATKLEILNRLEREHHGHRSEPKPVAAHDYRSLHAAARAGLQGMPIRDLDAIHKRSEMLLQRDPQLDVPFRESERPRARVRPTDAGDARKRRLEHVALTQPSSVVAQLRVELKERYEQASDKEKYAEIRDHLDCGLLLLQLAGTHGITPTLYQVKSAKDGSSRIQCGSRALTANDFLTKELGLPWREAAPILRAAYQTQLGIEVVAPKDPKALLLEYKKEKAELDTRRKAARTLLNEKQNLARNASYALRKQLGVAVTRAAIKEELRDQQDAEREALTAQFAMPPYAEWKAAPGVTGKLILKDEEEKKQRRQLAQEHTEDLSSKLRLLVSEETKEGHMIYRSAGVDIFRDEGRRLAVLDPNSNEAIALTLAVAQEKFGKTLTLTGDRTFQQRVAAVAVARGLNIEFADKAMEEYRKGLKLSKQTDDRKRNAPAKPAKVIPVSVPAAPHPTQPAPLHRAELAPIQPIREAEPAPQASAPALPTVEQWIEQWLIDHPNLSERKDAPTPSAGKVLFVAEDGRWIQNLGQFVAIRHTDDVVVHVGDEVEIDKNGKAKIVVKGVGKGVGD